MSYDLKGRINSLFGRLRKHSAEPPLSDQVVDAELLDHDIFHEMLERSSRLRGAVKEPVEYADPNDPNTAKAYEQAENLWEDIFTSLHTYSEPHVHTKSEVKPSVELNRQIMSELTTRDGFTALRSHTQHDELMSTLGAYKLIEQTKPELIERLVQQIETSNQIQEIEGEIGGFGEGEGEGEGGEGQPVDGEGRAPTKEELDAAKQRLEELLDEQQQQGDAGQAIANAIDDAADEASETARAYGALPGVGQGTTQRLSPDKAMQVAETWRNSPDLQQLAATFGRMERDMRFRRSNRVVGGVEEPIDITTGNDIPKILPSELMRLKHPALRKDFIRRFYERGILQHEMIGHAEAGLGPVVIGLDRSGSMGRVLKDDGTWGSPADLFEMDANGQYVKDAFGEVKRRADAPLTLNTWATAFCLSTISLAHKEKRHAVVVAYDWAITGVWEFPAKQPIDVEKVTDFATHFSGGGTETFLAVERCAQIVEEDARFKKADIVLVADGADSPGQRDYELRDRLRERGVRIHGVAIGMDAEGYLTEICDPVSEVFSLTASNEATQKLATHMTS